LTGKTIPKNVSVRQAKELIDALNGIPDAKYESRYKDSAYVLSDGRYLIRIQGLGKWRLWPSEASFWSNLPGSSVVDPVQKAIPDAAKFIGEAELLAQKLVELAAVDASEGLDAKALGVSSFLARRPGDHWIDDPDLFAQVVAFWGQFAVTRTRARWFVREPDKRPGLRFPNGDVWDVARDIQGLLDEAPPGSYSLVDEAAEHCDAGIQPKS
jgi:hypothetical protein